jgi:hypothetical protein
MGERKSIMADNAWAMFRNELLNFLGGDPAQFTGLQIVSDPPSLEWDNLTYGEFDSFNFANTIPVWDANWPPQLYKSSNNHVDSEYINFIHNINAPAQDPEAAKQAAALTDQLIAARKKIDQTRIELGKEWKTVNDGQKDLPPELQITVEDWYAQNAGPTLSEMQTNLDGLLAQWIHFANKAAGGFASLAHADDDFKLSTKDLKDRNGFPYPGMHSWNIVPPLADFVNQAKADQAPVLNMTVKTGSSTTDTTSWGVGGSASIDVGFFGVDVGGSYDRTSTNTTTQDFKMTFSSKGFMPIQIMAGPWFHQDVLIQFKNGPFILPTQYFGSGGALNLIAVTAYVAYQPIVDVTLDQSTFTRLQTAWEVHTEVAIGPFSFGGSAHGSSDEATFKPESRTIHFGGQSPFAQLVALACNIMPNG